MEMKSVQNASKRWNYTPCFCSVTSLPCHNCSVLMTRIILYYRLSQMLSLDMIEAPLRWLCAGTDRRYWHRFRIPPGIGWDGTSWPPRADTGPRLRWADVRLASPSLMLELLGNPAVVWWRVVPGGRRKVWITLASGPDLDLLCLSGFRTLLPCSPLHLNQLTPSHCAEGAAPSAQTDTYQAVRSRFRSCSSHWPLCLQSSDLFFGDASILSRGKGGLGVQFQGCGSPGIACSSPGIVVTIISLRRFYFPPDLPSGLQCQIIAPFVQGQKTCLQGF
jgi:hypothetical protein